MAFSFCDKAVQDKLNHVKFCEHYTTVLNHVKFCEHYTTVALDDYFIMIAYLKTESYIYVINMSL